MKITKDKGSEGSPTFNVYKAELSYAELVAIENALADNHAGPVADELFAGFQYFIDRLPKPGEEPEKDGKKDSENPDDLLPSAEEDDEFDGSDLEDFEEEPEAPGSETPETPEASEPAPEAGAGAKDELDLPAPPTE